MKRKIYGMLLVFGMLTLLAGCQDATGAKRAEAPVKQEEAKREADPQPEVRSSFITEQDEEAERTQPSPETEQAVLETETQQPEETEAIAPSVETFDYVALGNSITCNEAQDGLWWGSWGMAASSQEKDYVHLVSAWLSGQMEKQVSTTVLDLKKWEVAQQRDAVLEDYREYFGAHTDLVTIQTGENITEFRETLGMDYLNLVAYIKELAPDAQILMLGQALWPSEDIEAAKQTACQYYGVSFVDMTAFLEGYEAFYKSPVGTVVSGADGAAHAIENEVVAAHPNDEGMACIAQQIINRISIPR